ncbi:hypothetical protein PG994_003022 [Apiospora phragmitis]|uniref:RING-type domain-containing protein n=1 Tax=Apiospora phragmitis TaxID=2905665 RepID=A0ABR1W6U8_9PEZI
MSSSGPVQVIQADYINTILEHIENSGRRHDPGGVLSDPRGDCRNKKKKKAANENEENEEDEEGEEVEDPKEEFYEKYGIERTVFLHCGHIIGRDCYEAGSMDDDVDARKCLVCRKDNLCSGCSENTLYDDSFDPVSWPLNPATFNPYHEFRHRAGFTGVEKDPDAQKYCGHARPAFPRPQASRSRPVRTPTTPRAPAVPGSTSTGARPTSTPRGCAPSWPRSAASSSPRAVDIRDPHLATSIEAEMALERTCFEETLLADPRIAKLRQAVFKPCFQDGPPFWPWYETLKLQPADTMALFDLAWEHSQVFWDRMRQRLPVGWYRDGDDFLLHEVKYEHNPFGGIPIGKMMAAWVINDNDPKRVAYKNLMMLIGKDNMLEGVKAFNCTMVSPEYMELIDELANAKWPTAP